MSKFKIPYEFVSGTKAKANEVNENFNAIKEELNKKVNINENNTIDVEDGINPKNAINKSQLEKCKNEFNNQIIDSTINKETKKGFLIESGNLDNNNNVDLLDIEDSTKLRFKVDDGTIYKPLHCVLANGETFTRTSIPEINIAELQDGTYNLFIGKEGDCIPLSSNIFRQKTEPEKLNELTWTQPILSENGTLGENKFAVYCATIKQGSAYNAFDNNINVGFVSSIFPQSSPNHIIIYNPIPIKIESINYYNLTAQYATAGYISYSDDNSTWIEATTFNGLQPYWNTLTVNSQTFHNYWRITITNSTASGMSNMRVQEININATYQKGNFLSNSVWLDTSTKPYKSKKYNGETWEDFNYTPLPQSITVKNGTIVSINNILYYGDNGYDNYVMLPDMTKSTIINEDTTFKAIVDGWIYNGENIVKPLFTGETFITNANANNYVFYQMKGVK